jgi:hypothetical protein
VGADVCLTPSSDQLIAVVPLGALIEKVKVFPVGCCSTMGAVASPITPVPATPAFGSLSFSSLALNPGASPAAVSVKAWRTSGDLPCATQVTLTVMRFRSSGCGSSFSVPSVELSAQNGFSPALFTCLP